MKKLLLTLSLVSVGAALAASSAGAGGQAGYGCAPGFDLGGLTMEQGLALPRVQAGLAAGVFDLAGLSAQFNKVDHNGNGVPLLQGRGRAQRRCLVLGVPLQHR